MATGPGYRRERSIRRLTDETGKRWAVERIGRTSGIVPPPKSQSDGFPQPADIVRFTCESDRTEPSRETAMLAGLLEQMTDLELRALLKVAPRAHSA
jgi:hypothetical protein